VPAQEFAATRAAVMRIWDDTLGAERPAGQV